MRDAGLAVRVAGICILAFSASLFAQQAGPAEPEQPVTVAQLTEIVGRAKGKHDREAAKEIEHLQLTERLSSPKLAMLTAELRGAKSMAALMAVVDASVFLEPPEEAIPEEAAPGMEEQRQMLSRVVSYLRNVIPKLPNFYARRFTTSFESVWTPKGKTSTHNQDALRPRGTFRATVNYRGGKEVVHAEGAEEHGFTTRGTFGPILSTVVVDAARSGTTQWSRWEEGPNGPMAVFRFDVPQRESHYQVSFPVPEIGDLGAMGPTAYHGEMGVDPSSGTILRLMLEAEPGLGSSMVRSDIMVEYKAVDIGSKSYTCPIRSVSIATAKSIAIGMNTELSLSRLVTRLDDVTFDNYHVFRSESRIVPYTP